MWIYFDEIEPIKINKGVLQGDCLSPTLFNLFIADLSFSLENGIALNNHQSQINHLIFADDIVLMADNHLYLQQNLNILYLYLHKIGLEINVNKTKHLVFSNHSKRKQRKLFVANSPLEQVRSFNYLGVEFWANLNWNKTINDRINSTINTFHTIWAPLYKMKFSNLKLAFALFDRQILPKLLYGVHVWGIGNSDLLERIQTTFIKKMLSLPPNTGGY